MQQNHTNVLIFPINAFFEQCKQQGAEVPHSSEPQKAHPTGEFVVEA